MDAVQGVLATLIEIERPGPQRIRRASSNARGIRTEPRLNLRGRNPIRPFGHPADRGNAGEGHGLSSDGDAVTDRLALWQHVIKKPRIGIDEDRAWSLPALIVDDMPLEGFGNAGLRIRRIGQQLPVSRRKAYLRRRCERRLHATTKQKAEVQPREYPHALTLRHG